MRRAQLKPDLATYNALKLGGMVFRRVYKLLQAGEVLLGLD